MCSRGAFARVIVADVCVIDEAWHRRDQCSDNSEQHRVKRFANEIGRRWKSEARQIEQKAEDKQSDREMNQHRMQWMPERFTFKEIFKHIDLTPVEDSPRRPRR